MNGRNPVELVRLTPGMRYLGQQGGFERGTIVQGLGSRDDGAEFQLDGLNANAGMDEGGFAIPNVDTIAELNVETSNFSAEHGRNPLQVLVVTKGGTNGFHGTLWEFHRNSKMDARNTFASTKPKLIRNQFGYSVGGPIIKDKTFFFTSYEGLRIRQERIYNSVTIRPEMIRVISRRPESLSETHCEPGPVARQIRRPAFQGTSSRKLGLAPLPTICFRKCSCRTLARTVSGPWVDAYRQRRVHCSY